MKYVRRLAAIVLLIIIGIAAVSRDIPRQLVGDASQALQVYYNIKKADEINGQEILFYIDENPILFGQNTKPFMEENLELSIPVMEVSRIFNCMTSVVDEQRVIFALDDRTVTVSDDLKEHFGLQYVSVSLLSDYFGYTWQWQDDVNGIFLESTELGTEVLPARYDMRDAGELTTVRSQGNYGTCWAFASLSALESTLSPEELIVFAVDHLSLLSGFNINQQDGGDYNMALAYMASWRGPVLEADDPYGDNKTDETLTAVKHLQGAVNIEAKDYEKIKQMIYTTGGVQSSFYSDMETATSSTTYYNRQTYGYYYMGDAIPNHDIVIIGWDDQYPKENFNFMPENNGAFICRNSWGTEFGEDGYFYISYEDTNIGVNNIVYTRVDNTDNYDNIYQSDLLGWVGSIGYNEEEAYFANVYQTNGEETLRAVSFYATGPDTWYDLYVVENFQDSQSMADMKYLQSGYMENAGYYTVDIEAEIDLAADSSFAVVVKIKTAEAIRPVAIEYAATELSSTAVIDDGYGYISYEGHSWERVEDEYGCNVCLKAFTDAK